MKKIRIILVGLVAVLLSSCYSHRVIGYLQEPTKMNKLPQYDSVPYEPYRIRVNDEIIYRLVTLDETMGKVLATNNVASSGQYANSYRVYQDGTIELPFLQPLKVQGLTEVEAQEVLREAFREIIPDADVKLALYNKYFSVIGDAHSSQYYIYKEKVKLHDVMAQMDKWYIRRVLKKDLRQLMLQLQQGKTTYENQRQHITYQLTPIAHETEQQPLYHHPSGHPGNWRLL